MNNMLFYATEKTKERLKIPYYHELTGHSKLQVMTKCLPEDKSDLFKWGCQLFYYNRRKCVFFMNFSTKFGVFLYDVKVKEVADLPIRLVYYLEQFYEDNPEFLDVLRVYLSETTYTVYDELTDAAVIAAMSSVMKDFLRDGARFVRYIHKGMLHTKKMCHDYNYGVKEELFFLPKDHIFPGEAFEKAVKSRYTEWYVRKMLRREIKEIFKKTYGRD